MTDRYTRAVLTVYRGKGTIDRTYAAQGDEVQKVVICGEGATSCMDIAALNNFLILKFEVTRNGAALRLTSR